MLKEKTNTMHMIHEKILEKHKLINKRNITSIHHEIHKQAHGQKLKNKITIP